MLFSLEHPSRELLRRLVEVVTVDQRIIPSEGGQVFVPGSLCVEEEGRHEKPGDWDPIDHLLWGDYASFLGPEQGECAEVRVRGKNGWMRKEVTQEYRLLEVDFVDIGQGDGCFLLTPEDQLSRTKCVLSRIASPLP